MPPIPCKDLINSIEWKITVVLWLLLFHEIKESNNRFYSDCKQCIDYEQIFTLSLPSNIHETTKNTVRHYKVV